MNSIPLHSLVIRRSLLAAASALCFMPAIAAEPAAATSSSLIATAQAQYAKDRAACLSGDSPEGKATCLKEAGAQFEMMRRDAGNLPDQSPQALRENKLRRCQAVAAADRYACEQMALGKGVSSGSVAGGGVLTEYTTIVPAQ